VVSPPSPLSPTVFRSTDSIDCLRCRGDASCFLTLGWPADFSDFRHGAPSTDRRSRLVTFFFPLSAARLLWDAPSHSSYLLVEEIFEIDGVSTLHVPTCFSALYESLALFKESILFLLSAADSVSMRVTVKVFFSRTPHSSTLFRA